MITQNMASGNRSRLDMPAMQKYLLPLLSATFLIRKNPDRQAIPTVSRSAGKACPFLTRPAAPPQARRALETQVMKKVGLSSTNKRQKFVRSASRPKKKRLDQVESKGPKAVGTTRKKSTQHEFLTTMTAPQREFQAERLAFQDEQRRRQQKFEWGIQKIC